MRRFEDFTQQKNRHLGIKYFDQYFCTRENLLVQIFWPRILKFSPAFSVNAGLISDPDNMDPDQTPPEQTDQGSLCLLTL